MFSLRCDWTLDYLAAAGFLSLWSSRRGWENISSSSTDGGAGLLNVTSRWAPRSSDGRLVVRSARLGPFFVHFLLSLECTNTASLHRVDDAASSLPPRASRLSAQLWFLCSLSSSHVAPHHWGSSSPLVYSSYLNDSPTCDCVESSMLFQGITHLRINFIDWLVVFFHVCFISFGYFLFTFQFLC